MIPGVPLTRGFRVFLTLGSGRREVFDCDDFRVTRKAGTNELTGLGADGAPAFPDYIRLDAVAAVTSIRIIRLRPLTGREVVWWTFALGLAALLRFALHWI